MALQVAIVVALITAGLSLIVAIYNSHMQWCLFQAQRNVQQEIERLSEEKESAKSLLKFTDPLLAASVDLVYRFHNILKADSYILCTLLESEATTPAKKQKREYVIVTTAFYLCQFFAWCEIIRKELLFLNIGDSQKTKELCLRLEEIRDVFATHSQYTSNKLQIDRAKQRAIGEVSIAEIDGKSPMRPIGYCDFVAACQNDNSRLKQWVNELLVDIGTLNADDFKHSSSDNGVKKRLKDADAKVQELMHFLDLKGVRLEYYKKWGNNRDVRKGPMIEVVCELQE